MQDFKDLKLMDIYKGINEYKTTIFRYKASTTKAVARQKELRYMNGPNQISAIKSMDWSDGLKNYSEIPILILNGAVGIPFSKDYPNRNRCSFPIWIILLCSAQ
jgi:hypothetical protein